MPEYVDEAFTVLVHIHGSGGAPGRETYVVGCPTREEAEARIRGLYPLELEVKVSPLPSAQPNQGAKIDGGGIPAMGLTLGTPVNSPSRLDPAFSLGCCR